MWEIFWLVEIDPQSFAKEASELPKTNPVQLDYSYKNMHTQICIYIYIYKKNLKLDDCRRILLVFFLFFVGLLLSWVYIISIKWFRYLSKIQAYYKQCWFMRRLFCYCSVYYIWQKNSQNKKKNFQSILKLEALLLLNYNMWAFLLSANKY